MPDEQERDSEPTYEELRERNAALVSAQQARIAELEGRLADLERHLGRNPRNSSMPPSAEGLAKPPVPDRAQRRADKRKPGKQPGAEGKRLVPVEHPDEVVVHRPGPCEGCGGDLEDGELLDVEIRQVFDTPPVLWPHVTEHQMQRRRCRCGLEQKAAPPPEATALEHGEPAAGLCDHLRERADVAEQLGRVIGPLLVDGEVAAKRGTRGP